MSYPPYEKASQMPRMMVPPAPIAAAPFPILASGFHPDRLRRRVGAPDRDDQHREEDEPGDEREGAQDVQGEKPVVEAHGQRS